MVRDRALKLFAHEDRPWVAAAACRNSDTDMFFSLIAGDAYTDARRVCAGCSVIVECGDYAVRTHQPYGMWGGMSPTERMRRRKEGR